MSVWAAQVQVMSGGAGPAFDEVGCDGYAVGVLAKQAAQAVEDGLSSDQWFQPFDRRGVAGVAVVGQRG
jgi:hypothetical protein